MKTKFNLFFAALGVAFTVLCTIPAQADVGTIDFGVTNAVIAANSTNSAIGTGTVNIDNTMFPLLEFKGGTIATNAANVIIPIYLVDSDGNVATTALTNWSVPQIVGTPGTPTTNNVVAFLQLTDAQVAGAYGLSCPNLGNTSLAGNLQSPSLKVIKKRIR